MCSSDLLDVLAKLAFAATAENRGDRPISHSIDLLRNTGLLCDDGSRNPQRTAKALMQIGAANLSVGRLVEGHLNALFLVHRYGTPRQKETIIRQIEQGAFLGVWAADAMAPVVVDPGGETLRGRKNYASGLGTLSHAIVTVDTGAQVRMALIDVSDPLRADLTTWNMPGMNATASGNFDCHELPLAHITWIGAPGDYLQEPHFVGGVWRIAALQAGASLGLLDAAAAELRRTERMSSEAQKARLMGAVATVWAGMALTDRAAEATAAHASEAEMIVSTSIAARLFTENAALDAIRVVEQSLGLQHFAESSRTRIMACDLSVYLRQAARDALLQRAAEHVLGQNQQAWGAFG